MSSTALVLGGGGAKGTFHVGVWEALKKLEIPVDAVFGNSSGAIVAAFIIQGNFEKALQLMTELELRRVIKMPENPVDKDRLNITEKNFSKFYQMQKSFLLDRGLDTSPLRELLTENLDEKTIRDSGLDFGVMTFMVNKMKPREIYINQMEEGKIVDYIMASATVPGFKLTQIGDDKFLDGGVYNNVPISLAVNRGYRNIIVVDLAGLGVYRKLEINGCRVTYIKNRSNFGGFLEFDQNSLDSLREQGYRDAMKVFGKMEGKYYYFYKNKNITGKLNDILFNTPDIIPDDISSELKSDNKIGELLSYLPENIRNHKKPLIIAAECAAASLDLEMFEDYEWEAFLNKVDKKCKTVQKEIDSKLTELSFDNALEIGKEAIEMIKDAVRAGDKIGFNRKQNQYRTYYQYRKVKRYFSNLPIPDNKNPVVDVARVFFNAAALYLSKEDHSI